MNAVQSAMEFTPMAMEQNPNSTGRSVFSFSGRIRASTEPPSPPASTDAVLLVLVGHVGAGVHSGVGQLQAGNGPVAADGVGGVGGAGQRVQYALVQVIGVGAVGLGVNHALGHGDRRRAALGPKLIECGGLGANTPVIGNISAAHRSGEHPVAENSAAQGDGCAEVGIFILHDFVFLLYEKAQAITASAVLARAVFSPC